MLTNEYCVEKRVVKMLKNITSEKHNPTGFDIKYAKYNNGNCKNKIALSLNKIVKIG